MRRSWETSANLTGSATSARVTVASERQAALTTGRRGAYLYSSQGCFPTTNMRALAGRAYEPGEITALGDAIYHEQLRSQIGPMEKGTFVVIDVDTGDYEIDVRDATATRRPLKRKPDAVTYGVRVGHRAAYSHTGVFRASEHGD